MSARGNNAWSAAAVLVVVLLTGCDQLPSPTYEECILRNSRAVANDTAAALIAVACRAKHPPQPPFWRGVRELKQAEYLRLTGRADQATQTARFAGTLYNGNSNITVTQFKIALTNTVGENEVVRAYLVEVPVRPLTATQFSIEMVAGDIGKEFKWEIIGASGFEQ